MIWLLMLFIYPKPLYNTSIIKEPECDNRNDKCQCQKQNQHNQRRQQGYLECHHDTGWTVFYKSPYQCYAKRPRSQCTNNPCQQHIGETFRNHHLSELLIRHTNTLHDGKFMTAGNDIGHNQIDEVDQAHQSKYSTYHSANQQDTQALGKTAAAKLIELIEKPRTALVDRILIPGRLVEGASVQAIEPQE